jgi:hypothetical protein
MNEYLFIGDLHGHARQLKSVLNKAGFTIVNGAYWHPELKAVFVGDFINRGTENLECLRIVRAMVESGNALAVIGNHEVIFLNYHQQNPQTGEYTMENRAGWNRLFQQTMLEFSQSAAELNEMINWLKRLPIVIETAHFNVVHACYDSESLEVVRERTNGNFVLQENDWLQMGLGADEALTESLHALTFGISIYLDTAELFPGSNMSSQHSPRIRYWEDPFEKSLRQTLFIEDDKHLAGIGFLSLPESFYSSFRPYPKYETPVVHSHYCVIDDLKDLPQNIIIADRAVIKTGILKAWNPDLGWIQS